MRELKDDLNNFLSNNAFYIALSIAILIILVVFILLMCFRKGNKKPAISSSDWLIALGGKDNILSTSSRGSRLVLSLKNKDAINREDLTKLGTKSIIEMSDKITLVLNDDASKINDVINEKTE